MMVQFYGANTIHHEISYLKIERAQALDAKHGRMRVNEAAESSIGW